MRIHQEAKPMLLRIDVDEKNIVEQGDGYIVVDVGKQLSRHNYGCKLRTTKNDNLRVFEGLGDPLKEIKRAKAVYVGVNGAITMDIGV
jgi:hypothetical protein